jgi:hypothetical protein
MKAIQTTTIELSMQQFHRLAVQHRTDRQFAFTPAAPRQ